MFDVVWMTGVRLMEGVKMMGWHCHFLNPC